jgi:hypothetical protein
LLLALGGGDIAASGMLIGGYRSRDNRFGVAAVHPNGQRIWSHVLPGRLHEMAVEPHLQQVAAFARRPGKFIALLDSAQGHLLGQIDVPEGFVFEGHGLWQDAWLWATAATENGAAHLLAYDLSAGYAPGLKPSRIIALPGIGPHQVLALGGSLVVALGGWRTNDREILNAEDFESALAWVDLHSGETRLLASPDPQLSVRHLATDGETIWAGLQYANPHAGDAALIYQTTGSGWQALPAPEPGWKIFSGYIGSLAQVHDELLATSPRGHRFGRWNLPRGRCVETASVLDVCPVAAGNHQWFVGSGTGALRSAHSDWHASDFFWDNHWTYLNLQGV